MPQDGVVAEESFGQRLARLRKAAGFTQTELAEEIGGTRRVIAYYETESAYPPATLLTQIATALKVTTDELLGAAAPKKAPPGNARLTRRLQQIEQMAARDKRQVLQVLDAFIERAQLKQASR